MHNGIVSKNDVDSHAELLARGGAPAQVIPEHRSTPPMRVTWIDRLAVESLVDGNPEEIRKLHVLLEETMNGLCDDPEPARQRVLSRTISLLRAKLMILEGIADRMLAARDFPAMTAVQKALDGTTRRLTMLLAEHRLATQGERRSVSVAVVGQATQVNVQALR